MFSLMQSFHCCTFKQKLYKYDISSILKKANITNWVFIFTIGHNNSAAFVGKFKFNIKHFLPI